MLSLQEIQAISPLFLCIFQQKFMTNIAISKRMLSHLQLFNLFLGHHITDVSNTKPLTLWETSKLAFESNDLIIKNEKKKQEKHPRLMLDEHTFHIEH